MIIRSLYIDTSVIGGYFDSEWQEATRELWRQRAQGKWRFFTSTVTAEEIRNAPAEVRELFYTYFPAQEWLRVDEETEALADAYLAARVLPKKFSDDARHVASCVLSSCFVLVSWNFKHLCNVNREAGFNAVNLLQGRPALRIVSPLELIYEDEDETI